MSLKPEEIQEKISTVKQDVEKMRSEGTNVKQIGVLQDYIEYLEYELQEAINGNGSREST